MDLDKELRKHFKEHGFVYAITRENPVFPGMAPYIVGKDGKTAYVQPYAGKLSPRQKQFEKLLKEKRIHYITCESVAEFSEKFTALS